MSENLIVFTLPTPVSLSFGNGEANGYVAIPKGHPLYEMDYDEIHEKYDIDIHHGLTFANYGEALDGSPEECKNMWVIGFDTCHYGDTKEKWPVHEVVKEAQRLKKQVKNIKPLKK